MTPEYDSLCVGGGLQANAAVQSPRLHPVVQSAEVPHRSGQLCKLDSMVKRVQSMIYDQHSMQPLNHPVQGAAQPSSAAGVQPNVNQRLETNNQPIDLTDD